MRGGVNPINQLNRSSNATRTQARARQKVTSESFDAKIREVERKGIRGDYGAYDTPIIMGDMERAKARYDGDYWKSEVKRLRAELDKQPNADEERMPLLEARRRQSLRREYREAVSIWNSYRRNDQYKNGLMAIRRLKKAGFTQAEINFYAER